MTRCLLRCRIARYVFANTPTTPLTTPCDVQTVFHMANHRHSFHVKQIPN
jgi:hypothetical protein